jgi:hypothetical protein
MARLTKLSPGNATWKNHLAVFDRAIAELAPLPLARIMHRRLADVAQITDFA